MNTEEVIKKKLLTAPSTLQLYTVMDKYQSPYQSFFKYIKTFKMQEQGSSWWHSCWRVNTGVENGGQPTTVRLHGSLRGKTRGQSHVLLKPCLQDRDSTRSTNKDTYVRYCLLGVCMCVCFYHSAGLCRGTFDYPVLRESSPWGACMISLWI